MDNCSVFTRDNGIVPAFSHSVPGDTICDISVDDFEIIRAMRHVNSNIAPGPEGIHLKFINNKYPCSIKALELLFNLSLSTGIVCI